MPTVRVRVPRYCLHKARGLAYVRDSGKFHYLGAYGSPESKEAYSRFLIELEARRVGAPLPSPDPSGEMTLVELCAAYLDFAEGYYVKNGHPTGEMSTVYRSLRLLRELYGHTATVDFGPLALRTVQEQMVHSPPARASKKPTRYSRKTINSTCESIKRIFKWAASHELIPVAVYQALATVPGLKHGRTCARESNPIRPVASDVVEATLHHLPPVVADMVRFERLTGCRPGEVCTIRPCDMDRSGEVWQYRPDSHKTEHHGRQRIVFVGPKAQAILLPYLLRAANAYCFSPAESVTKQNLERRGRRRTRVQPSQQNRRKEWPKKAPSTRYKKDAYRQAIVRGLAKANRANAEQAAKDGVDPCPIPAWHPNQLRHSAATDIRHQFGLEAAQVVLGHAKADVTQVYAERDYRLAVEVAKKIG